MKLKFLPKKLLVSKNLRTFAAPVPAKPLNDAQKLNKDNDAWYEPSHFEYKRLPITTGARAWWNGFDVKWYLFPFPQTEVLKVYLVQNPGW